MGNAAGSARKACPVAGMSRLFLLPALMAFSLAGPAGAATCPAPDTLREDVVERHFTQERHIEGMSKPLRSEGVLRANEERIVWHMTSPFDVETVITADGITESVDGGTPQPVNAGPANMGAGIARSAAALMRGQWDELRTLFNVSSPAVLESGDWEILLTPLQDRMKSVIGTIRVQGCTEVAGVEIGGAGGDRQVIDFSSADDAS